MVSILSIVQSEEVLWAHTREGSFFAVVPLCRQQLCAEPLWFYFLVLSGSPLCGKPAPPPSAGIFQRMAMPAFTRLWESVFTILKQLQI